ncbi:MAG: hypothetical protein D6722_00385 [Bacteroidetes bacterium]|nr:MAG: hypothetical protein D6722_00385 [Bacteroidota bacterium]
MLGFCTLPISQGTRFLLILCLTLPASLAGQGAWMATGTPYDLSTNPYEYRRHECGAEVAHTHNKRTGVLIGGRGGSRPAILLDLNSYPFYLHRGSYAPVELHHIEAVVWRDSLIVAGMGFTGGYPSETPSPNIIAYDAASDSWQILENNIPSARRRGSASAVIDGDWLYFFCGLTNGHQSGWVPWTDRYHLVTGTWQSLPDAPRARDHSVAVVEGRNVYLVGGRRSAVNNGGLHSFMVDSLDVFNLDSHSWSTLPTRLPTPRAGLLATILDNAAGHPEIMAWGGEYSGGVYNIGEGYDLISNNWEPLPSLAGNAHGDQLMKINHDSLVVMSGAYLGGNEWFPTSPEYVQLYAANANLPVEWLSVEARQSGMSVTISWEVEETFVLSYQVERRSQDGIWEPLTEMRTNGNGRQQYAYLDANLPAPGRYIYRIRQTDFDGQSTLSPQVETYIQGPFSVYPNPVALSRGLRQLTVQGDLSFQAVHLYDLQGRQIPIEQSGQQLILPASLPAGLYPLQFVRSGQRPVTIKLRID